MVDTSKYEATFTMLDADGDGLVSATELKELFETLGEDVPEHTAEEAVSIMDLDGDGKVSLQELADYLASGQAPPPPA